MKPVALHNINGTKDGWCILLEYSNGWAVISAPDSFHATLLRLLILGTTFINLDTDNDNAIE